MSSLTVFIELAPAIGLAAVLVSVVVNGIALHRASRKMNELRAVAGGLSIEVRALHQKIKGLELAYSDLVDVVDAMIDKPEPTPRLNGAHACDVPRGDDDAPF